MPQTSLWDFELLEAQPQGEKALAGKPQAYRTEGGKAAGLTHIMRQVVDPHIVRQSRDGEPRS